MGQLTYPPITIRVLLVLLVAVAGIYDLRYRRIPNWLTVSGVVLGVGMNTFLYEMPGLKFSLWGFGVALAVYLPLYAIRAMGAGDVKLMAAVGALVGGPWNWLAVFAITAILGGVVAVLLVATKGRVRNTLGNILYMLSEMAHLRPPYMRHEELDVRSPKAATLPHGAVITPGALAFPVAGAIWAPK